MSRRSSRGGAKKKAAAADAAAAPAPSDDAGAAQAEGAASAAASANTAAAAAATSSSGGDPTDDAVLAYLRKRGLDGAAVELGRSLRAEKRWKEQQEEEEAEKGGEDDNDKTGDNAKDDDGKGVAMELEEEERLTQHSRTPLHLSTGGGLGYDLDAAPHMALWGCGDGTAGAGAGEIEEDIITEAISGAGVAGGADADKDGAAASSSKAKGPAPAEDGEADDDRTRRGQDEARKFVRAFTALQTWVLSLPDDAPGAAAATTAATVGSVVERAQQVAAEAAAAAAAGESGGNGSGKGANGTGSGNGGDDKAKKEVHVIPDASAAAAKAAASASQQPSPLPQRPHHPAAPSSAYYPTAPQIAPSCKPELLAVTFAALVHTYCELLEFNLDHTAASLLATYRHIYEPTHDAELADLDVCNSTAHVVELNKNVNAHTEVVAVSRQARQQLHSNRRKKLAVLGQMRQQAQQLNPQQKKACVASIQQIDAEMAKHEAREKEAVRRASKISARLDTLPFLRRARALRWQIVLSTHAYHLLASYLGRGDGVLLPMSSILLSRCYLSCEKRDPLPVVPSVVLEDMFLRDDEEGGVIGSKSKDVRWAAPVDPTSRAAEEGEDLRIDDQRSILNRSEPLPFPKFYLDPNAEVSTEEEAKAEKRRVEFNRALLINGFRRLEALECRREYESGMRVPGAAPKSFSATTGKAVGSGATIVEDEEEEEEAEPYREFADPHSPSILLSTLCAARPSSGPSWSYGTAGGASAAMEGGAAVGSTLLQESGIDICCAQLCPPDGRRVAAGCDDAAVRIWTIGGDEKTSGSSSTGASGAGGSLISSKGVTDTADIVNKPEESAIVLLGHKNGFPIFDLDWNRDGRTLLSAGGDGSIRLWDTSAVGPFGRLANVVKKTHTLGTTSTTVKSSDGGEPNTSVPGMRTEPMVEVSGAALACYRGHSPSSPIWSVSFAPSGYYFASAGWDSTARIWTTDNPAPVRILSGHFSPSVNSIDWHPNANYVATAADDKTVRLWDVQTGRCVRLLNGVSTGLNLVKICPSGKYAAASDYSGIVHIWDLGSGRKVNELRLPAGQSGVGGTTAVAVQSMSYSACGTALATGGDDCAVRIWDVRGAAGHMSNPDYVESQGYGGSAGSAGGSGAAGPMSLPSDSQLARRPIGEQFRLGAREPVKCFRTRRTIIMDLQYTKANLLLSVGKYSASAGL